MPEKISLNEQTSPDGPHVICGHFNRLRKFGIEDYYPEAQQFLTVLRNPFDMHLSRFFYTKAQSPNWLNGTDVDNVEISEHILQGHLNMLEHFPRPVTMENYKDMIEEFFIYVGVFERLDDSFARMAAKINKPYYETLVPHINSTPRDDKTYLDDYARFKEKWPLEFAVYDYACALMAQEDKDLQINNDPLLPYSVSR